MQDGSVSVEWRKRGPDVWCFRWREAGPDGRRVHRRIVLGTITGAVNLCPVPMAAHAQDSSMAIALSAVWARRWAVSSSAL